MGDRSAWTRSEPGWRLKVENTQQLYALHSDVTFSAITHDIITKRRLVYLEVVSQIGGADQSACCLCSLNGSASHMTHTGEGGFWYSGLGSLGGGKPTHREREDRDEVRITRFLVQHVLDTQRL